MYYVLVKNGYEYDDEGFAFGSNYGEVYEKVEKVFTDKKKADKAALDLNRSEFRGICPYEYEPYRYDGAKPKYIEDLVGVADDTDYFNIPEDGSDELIDKYIEAFSQLSFWKVLEVE